jgi:micrococcal nuclease
MRINGWVILSGLVLLMPSLIGYGGADIYKWVDQAGQVHFTDNYALVPPEYRERAEIRPSTPPPEVSTRAAPPAPTRRHPRLKGSSRTIPRRGELAQVVAVLDGDTIVIDGGEKVRYAGVNAPESKHPDKLPEECGQEAFEANRRLVAGKLVRLEYDRLSRDQYGRLLAYVYADNLFINAELIRQGYAQASAYKENQRYYKDFLRLQRDAKTARRGLWGSCQDIRIPESPAKPRPSMTQRPR